MLYFISLPVISISCHACRSFLLLGLIEYLAFPSTLIDYSWDSWYFSLVEVVPHQMWPHFQWICHHISLQLIFHFINLGLVQLKDTTILNYLINFYFIFTLNTCMCRIWSMPYFLSLFVLMNRWPLDLPFVILNLFHACIHVHIWVFALWSVYSLYQDLDICGW